MVLDVLDAFGGGDDVDGGDVFGAALGEVVGGGDEGAAGGEHGVDEEALTAGEVFGETVGVSDLLGGVLFIALHAEEADFGGGDHFGHAVEHAESGAKDGNDDGGGAGDVLADHGGDGGFDGLVDDVEVAGRLVGFEHDEFGDELAESGG